MLIFFKKWLFRSGTIYDWWRGALCLYAQENDISSIIEDTYKRYRSFKKAKITLEAMIENTSERYQNSLKTLLSQYLDTDRMENSYLEYVDEIQESDYYVKTNSRNFGFEDSDFNNN